MASLPPISTRNFEIGRLSPDLTELPIAEQPTGVRVIRPSDLLAFDVSWSGLTLNRPGQRSEPGDAQTSDLPMLAASPDGGLLTFRFSFQHVAEEAGLVPELVPTVPVAARAARPSRLVFTVPAGTTIEYSIAGLLAAMGTLELAVAPAAIAAPARLSWFQMMATRATTASLPTQLLATAHGAVLTRFALPTDLGPAANRQVAVDAAGLIERQRALVVTNRLITAGALTAAGSLRKVSPGFRKRFGDPRRPLAGETAIEAPFRLILSPSKHGGWAHATKPVVSALDTGRIELWHSRLGVRTVQSGGVTINESATDQRMVRAIWTRDLDRTTPQSFSNPEDPFVHSLRSDWRKKIVAQTAGSKLAPTVTPEPVQVHRLAVSALGAWLDLDVHWDTKKYLVPGFGTPLASWNHVAPMGRDQYVRVDQPGYLFPLGHQATLVTITYRKIVGDVNPQAALFQKQYIVLGDRTRAFARPDMPFLMAKLGPGRTPDLVIQMGEAPFVPIPLGQTTPFAWRIDGHDHDGVEIHLKAPLVFVFANATPPAAQIIATYLALGDVAADSQTIAFAPALAAAQGQATARANAEVQKLKFNGVPAPLSSEPFMEQATVVIPAMQRLTPSAPPAQVKYPEIYKTSRFEGANVGNVFLELLGGPTTLDFGSSERSGGFIKPDVAVAGLARSTGLVSDIANAAGGTFDAAKLFSGGFPKLFGLFNLADLVVPGLLDLAPKFVTESLNKVSALISDLEALHKVATETKLAPLLETKAKAVQDAIEELLKGDVAAIGRAKIEAAIADAAAEIDALAKKIPGAPIDPMARANFDKLLASLQPLFAAANTITKTVDDIIAFANGLNPGGGEIRTRMDWRPELSNWPATGDPVFKPKNPKTALVVSVEARASAAHGAGTEVSAQLTDFELILVPGAQLMAVKFDRLAFRGGTSRRPEVDVVFGGIEFLGVLGFVNVLKELIPLDGFSDPPFLDVSAEGVSAGFTIALPNVAIGVFSLTNLSLGADARIPFLGESVSIGFNFCTRERPFTLAVAFLGGGGFVGIRLNPKGLVLLEAAIEFGAIVALDFGVASGSVSVMAGIYLRLESDKGSLTGYLRVRGEVDVLSLISASIELYMALTYAFDTGKMVGEATIKVAVHVLFFSASVSIHARRTFAGSNGDPTVRDMLDFDPGTGSSSVWDEYCAAFAPTMTEA